MEHLSHHAPILGAGIPIQEKEDWLEYRLAGIQLLDMAENVYLTGNPNISTEILYGLIVLAMEKLLMSRLMFIGRLPYDHTLHNLRRAVARWLPETIWGLEEQLRKLDGYQGYCNSASCTCQAHHTPDEIEAMLLLGRQLEQRFSVPRA